MVLWFADYNLELESKVMMDVLHLDTPALPSDKNRELFNSVLTDYLNIKTRRTQFEAVKNNPYFNALQIKFSYAVTCHKAQGGQWEAVFVDQGYLTEEMLNTEYLRWLYTAFTRPTERLYLVNFNKQFFEG